MRDFLDSSLPRLSIVTPSLNQAEFLEQAIRSVLDQDYLNLEYIIIDGGSTDGSIEIIKRHEEHLHFWCSEPDGGHYAAINKGFMHATGEIFAWLNSDDMYCEGAFHNVASVFQAFPIVQWISTLKQLSWDREGNCSGEHSLPGFSKGAFLDGLYFTGEDYKLGFIQQESTFWSSRLWNKAGGLDTHYDLAGDFDLWCKFFRHENLFGIEESLAGFRWHGNNRSWDISRYCEQAHQSLERLRSEFGWSGAGIYLWFMERVYRRPRLRRAWCTYGNAFARQYWAMNIRRDVEGGWKMVEATF